jgi:hypothetical protein
MAWLPARCQCEVRTTMPLVARRPCRRRTPRAPESMGCSWGCRAQRMWGSIRGAWVCPGRLWAAVIGWSAGTGWPRCMADVAVSAIAAQRQQAYGQEHPTDARWCTPVRGKEVERCLDLRRDHRKIAPSCPPSPPSTGLDDPGEPHAPGRPSPHPPLPGQRPCRPSNPSGAGPPPRGRRYPSHRSVCRPQPGVPPATPCPMAHRIRRQTRAT